MSNQRDNFTKKTIEILTKRVSFICSNPTCQKSTSEGKYTKMKLAVWFGNETHGLSEKAIENGFACITIPMCGMVESLNLGSSTGIVLYEITKQRREAKLAWKIRKSHEKKR